MRLARLPALRAPHGPRLKGWDTLAFALLTYLPFLWNNPGKVSADTKAYLYLNPGRLLQSATSMWNPDQGFGMVTHQNIGYLFPMGPYFWLTHSAGIPTWIAQRFWMGTLLFCAGLGVRKLAQELGLSRTAGWAVAMPYALTPFILVNIGRTSAILMPWAGLGWLMLYAIRTARSGRWRHAARFAIVVALVGGVNATSILLVGIAPAMWLVYAYVTREIRLRAFFAAIGKIGLLSTCVSLWWMAGLWAEGRYGINILRYTETIPTVASTSTSTEAFRGLGYWYFYGSDQIQLWTQASSAYTVGNIAPLPSLLLPTLAVLAGIVVHWRYRLFSALLAFAGIVIAVGSYPYGKPSPVGSILKWFGENTTAGLAMRSTNRVAPIFILGFSLLIGAGVDAVRTRWRRHFFHSVIVVGTVSVLAMAPLFLGTALAPNLSSSEHLPDYVTAAAKDLNATGTSENGVLGLPGLDFGYYNWGAYVDAAWPGLLRRPFVTSQVTLQGEPASVNLIRGLDGPIQDLVANPKSLRPIAQLLGTGDVLFQFDTQYDRFAGPPPWYVWGLASDPSNGLEFVKAYGPEVRDVTGSGRYVNEGNLALGTPTSWPPSLAVYRVPGVRSLVRTESHATAAVVAGDGEGLVNLAGLGIFPSSRAIFYDGTLSPQLLNQFTSGASTPLFITDTNQRRQNTFGVLHSSPGYVLQSGEKPVVPNPAQQTLYAFTNRVPGAQTVAVLGGLRSVDASSYGNPIGNNPEQQPYFAVDSDLSTSWKTAAFSDARGEFFELRTAKKVDFSSLRIVQPQDPTTNRWITRIEISIDGRSIGVYPLPDTTRKLSGGDVVFPAHSGTTLRLTVVATTNDSGNLRSMSGVGFAELGSPAWPVADQSLLMPTSLLRRAGNASSTNELTFAMTRLRAASTPPRTDPENALDRTFVLPNSRTFEVSGNATLNATMSDGELDALIGRQFGGVRASSSSHRLLGSLWSSSSSAFDGRPDTAWTPTFQFQDGQWIEFQLASPKTVSEFKIAIINDGLHSVPRTMTLTNGRESAQFSTGLQVATEADRGHIDTISVSVPPMSGTRFRLTVDSAIRVSVKDRVTGGVNVPPFALAEILIPGIAPSTIPTFFDSGCREGLMNIDGQPLSIRLRATNREAIDQRRISFTLCGPPITLTAGIHRLQSVDGRTNGINIEQVALHSPSTKSQAIPALSNLRSEWQGRTRVTTEVGPSDAGRWLVLGQSFSGGWRATVNGIDLGSPVLIDGASMGWRLPAKLAPSSKVLFEWLPQNRVWLALWLSLGGLFAALALAIGGRRPSVPLAPVSGASFRALGTSSSRSSFLVVLTSVVAGLAVSWYLVPVLAVLSLSLVSRPKRQLPWALGTLIFFALANAATLWAVHQFLTRDISWPSKVPFANTLTWLGLAFWLVYVVTTSDRPVVPEADDSYATDGVFERRRGLNMPQLTSHDSNPDETALLDVVVAPRGLLRTFALLRAQMNRRRNPALFEKVRNADTINQLVGSAPLYNRRVLQLSNLPQSVAVILEQRGARVTSIYRATPPSQRGYAPRELDSETSTPRYTVLTIPARDRSFDLVHATNVLSSVPDPIPLLNEMIRVTQPGGSIVIHNATWWSWWGGFETSPWHLISGALARRRYVRKHQRQPDNAFGFTLFRYRIKDIMDYIAADERVVVVSAGPYWLPSYFGWILNVPVLREIATVTLSVRLERIQG